MPITDQSTTVANKQRRIKFTDIVLFGLFILVCFFLTKTLFGQLGLKHEVTTAKTVTNRVITDIAQQRAADARSLGDKNFQAAHSTQQLANLFKSASTVAHGSPTIIHQTVSNNKAAQNVSIIYKYDGKPPYYIRVTATKLNHSPTWQLTGISGNPSEAALVGK